MVKKELVGWIIFLAIFISIIFVVTKMVDKQKASSENLACQTQLAVAAKGNPIGFSACHSYRIEFGKDAAIKYDMFQNDAEVYRYKYSDVLGKLKVIQPELDELKINKDEVIPEEIVYYIFAEEMKKCDATYNIGSFKTQSYFFLYSNTSFNVCQECAVFLFKEEFFPKTQSSASFQRINLFFQDIRIDKDVNITYEAYFDEKYNTNSVLSDHISIETNNIYKIIYQFQRDFSKIEGKKIPRSIGSENLLAMESWAAIDDTWNTKTDYTHNLKSVNLYLTNSENGINTCDLNLLLLPGGVVI